MQKLDLYQKLENLRNKKPTTNARTRGAEIAERYEKHIMWVTRTTANDRAVYYMAIHSYLKTHTEADLIKLLDWVKKKDTLHPLAVVKILKNENRRQSTI